MTVLPALPKDNPAFRRVAVVAYTEYAQDPRVRKEAETLAQDGYQVHVFALRPRRGATPSHLGGVHIHYVPLTARRGGKIRYAYQYSVFLVITTAWLFLLQKGSAESTRSHK